MECLDSQSPVAGCYEIPSTCVVCLSTSGTVMDRNDDRRVCLQSRWHVGPHLSVGRVASKILDLRERAGSNEAAAECR